MPWCAENWLQSAKNPLGQGWSQNEHCLVNSVSWGKQPPASQEVILPFIHLWTLPTPSTNFPGKLQVELLPVVSMNLLPREFISWPSSAPLEPLESPSFVAVRGFSLSYRKARKPKAGKPYMTLKTKMVFLSSVKPFQWFLASQLAVLMHLDLSWCTAKNPLL